MNPDDHTAEDECHCRHCHHSVVDIAEIIGAFRNDLEAEERTSAEEFADSTDSDKDVGIAKSVAYAVKE